METQERQSILIADSDQEFSRTMKVRLELNGYNVATVNDGNAALDLLAAEEFDLLISEIKLPGLGGIQLLEKINRTGIGVPVIFLTAYGEVESYLRVMNMGAYDYLNKPPKIKHILPVVEKAIETAGKCRISSR